MLKNGVKRSAILPAWMMMNKLTAENTSLRNATAWQAEKNTELIIYNIKGQKIKTFDVLECGNRVTAASTRLMHSITWNGTDESNQPVSSGIYLYQLKVGNKFSETKRMLLLK